MHQFKRHRLEVEDLYQRSYLLVEIGYSAGPSNRGKSVSDDTTRRRENLVLDVGWILIGPVCEFGLLNYLHFWGTLAACLLRNKAFH